MTTKLSADEVREVLRSVPQRIVGEMCGRRQTVQLHRMADRWRVPIDGKTSDLFAVMTWLWDFLKRYGPMLAAVMEDDGSGDDNSLGARFLRAKTRKTEAEAEAAELRVQEKAGVLCNQKMIHELLARLADRLRNAAEESQRRWGKEGYEMFRDLNQAFRRDLEAYEAPSEAAANSESEAEAKRPTRRLARRDGVGNRHAAPAR